MNQESKLWIKQKLFVTKKPRHLSIALYKMMKKLHNLFLTLQALTFHINNTYLPEQIGLCRTFATPPNLKIQKIKYNRFIIAQINSILF